ncbi:MAG: type II toxin-antitoxin system VapC family toxin, partial [Thermoplasmata archaeon]
SNISDNYFNFARRNEAVICFSEINLGESAVVFDKYSRKFGINASDRFLNMLNELASLERSSSVEIFPVSSQIIRKAARTVIEQHIYIVDAIQLETCKEAKCDKFCSADIELNTAAKKTGIATVL